MHEIGNGIIAVLVAIVGVAILAVLVSKQANTTGVIQAGATGFSQILGTAIAPITGQVPTTSYSTSGINLSSLGLGNAIA